jgi:hypothetical protein
VCESLIMTQTAAAAHPLDDDAIAAALLRVAAIDAGGRWRNRPLPGSVSRRAFALRSLAALGHADEGLTALGTGLADFDAFGFMLWRPLLRTLFADACRAAAGGSRTSQ